MEAPNAASRKSIAAAAKQARIRDRERREIITQIMVSRPGRAWLWDRLSECSIFSTTHVAADPYASAFQEGRRSVGLSLLADIMAYCPDQFITAMREQNERRNSNDGSPDPADAPSERLGSPLGDGGDSGAEPDSEAGSEADGGYASPGRDIYAEA